MSASKKNKARDKFKFVNYTSPHDARETNNRIRVRSHVTRWQHKHSRVYSEQPKVVDQDCGVGTGADDTKELVSDESSLDELDSATEDEDGTRVVESSLDELD